MKTCRECGVSRPIEDFWREAKGPDGRSARCGECRRKGLKRSRANPEIRERARLYAREYNKTISNEQHLWYFAKGRARKLGIVFDLKVEDIVIPEHCPLLGVHLARGCGKLQAASPSLDRKNPDVGYTRDNVWVISHRANTIKNNATLEELRQIVGVLESL